MLSLSHVNHIQATIALRPSAHPKPRPWPNIVTIGFQNIDYNYNDAYYDAIFMFIHQNSREKYNNTKTKKVKEK